MSASSSAREVSGRSDGVSLGVAKYEHDDFIRAMIRSRYPTLKITEDHMQGGRIGMLRALASWKEGAGSSLKTWSVHYIRAEVQRVLRSRRVLSHRCGGLPSIRPSINSLDTSRGAPGDEWTLHDVLAADQPSSDEPTLRSSDAGFVRECVRRLPARERNIVTLWMNGVSLREQSAMEGCSPQKISNVFMRAKRRLEKDLACVA